MGDAATILVINPNSSDTITDQIRFAAEAADGDVAVIKSPGGPPAIESDADVVAAVAPMIATATAMQAGAYVVACFSDPGLDELRAQTDVPAFGIAESAIHVALEQGTKVGIISSVADSLPRHARYWAKIGVTDKVVADVPLGLGVLELDTEAAYQAAAEAGRSLLASGADVVVLGCTGMTHIEDRLRSELGIPVVDPCRAAVETARRALTEATP